MRQVANRCPKRKGDAPRRRGFQGGLGGNGTGPGEKAGRLPAASVLGKERKGGVQPREGAGTAAGGPHNAHGTHSIPHFPPCLGPPSLSHIHASPHHPAISKAAHSSQTFSPSHTHTHTHTSFLCGLAPGTPHHTHSSTLFGSRVVELGWPKLTSLQSGPFPCSSLEAWPVETISWSRELNITQDPEGTWETWRLMTGRVPGSGWRARSTGQHKGTGRSRMVSPELGRAGMG